MARRWQKRGLTAVGTVLAVALLVVPTALAMFGDAEPVPANDFGTATLQPPSGLAVTTSCTGSAGSVPAFVGASTATGFTSPTSVARPAGTMAGDLLLAQVSADDTTAASASGWTLIRQDKDTNEGFYQAVLYRIAGSSEPASYSFNLIHSVSTTERIIGISAYRGVDPTTPIDAHGGNITTWPPGTNTVIAPSITTTVANTRLVALFGSDGSDVLGTPAGMTARWAAQIPGAQDAAALSADEARSTAGATGTRVSTRGGIQNNGIGQSVALRPVAGATTAGATVSWTASPSSFASGHRLERWHGGSMEAQQTVTPASTTTASDGPLVPGQVYEYRLVAVYQNWTSTTVVRSLVPTCGTGATLLWSRNGTTTPFTTSMATWWPSTQTTAAVGRWRTFEAAVAPTRDEVLAAGVRTDGAITAQMRSGSTWTGLSANPLATGRPATSGVDVAYESLSGDALLVWSNGTDSSTGVSYRVWNGSTWSGSQTITTPLSGEAETIRLASSPGADELILTVGDDDGRTYALVWDGTQWGDPVTLDSVGDGAGTEATAAYEAQSGEALVAYRRGTGTSAESLRYRAWDGSWSAEQVLAPPASGIGAPAWTALASSPTTNRIALGVATDTDAIWLATWTGSGWVDTMQAISTATNHQGPSVAVGFEQQSGEAFAAYGLAGVNSFGWRSWLPGSGWGFQGTVTAFGSPVHALTVDGRPGSDQIVVGAQTSTSTLTYLQWAGSGGSGGWSVATNPQLDGDTGEVSLRPFALVWE